MRRTVEIADLVKKVNERNRNSTCSADERQGWNSLVEDVMIENNVYSGFTYLEEKDVPQGELPGVVYGEENGIRASRLNKYPDGTRRTYTISAALAEKPRKVKVAA